MCLAWPPRTFLVSANDVKLFFLSLKNISARTTNSSATMTSAFTQHMSVTAMTSAVTTRTNKTVQVRLIGRLRPPRSSVYVRLQSICQKYSNSKTSLYDLFFNLGSNVLRGLFISGKHYLLSLQFMRYRVVLI